MTEFSPLFFCFIGPGASGKSSIVKALLGLGHSIRHSVSSTTRPPRTYEKEGKEYHFMGRPEFENAIAQGKFLEYAEFAGNLYGTGKENIETSKSLRQHLLLDIELHGVRSLRASYPDQTVVIFVCPPSLDALRSRFEFRGSDSPSRIEERMKLAKSEIAEAMQDGFSDYVIINEDFDLSVKQAESIVISEQIRKSRVDSPIL